MLCSRYSEANRLWTMPNRGASFELCPFSSDISILRRNRVLWPQASCEATSPGLRFRISSRIYDAFFLFFLLYPVARGRWIVRSPMEWPNTPVGQSPNEVFYPTQLGWCCANPWCLRSTCYSHWCAFDALIAFVDFVGRFHQGRVESKTKKKLGYVLSGQPAGWALVNATSRRSLRLLCCKYG